MEEKKYLEQIKVDINDLYLDPENYRIKKLDTFEVDKEEDILEKKVQEKILKTLKEYGISELIESLKINGYVPVDNIQVSEIPNKKNKYRILEGNRRVASLKILYESKEKIELFEEDFFRNIPVVFNSYEDKSQHLVLMGLKHISGNKKWTPEAQAQLVVDFIGLDIYKKEKRIEKAKIFAKKVGIRFSKIEDYIRTHFLIEEYKKTHTYESGIYSIFFEIIKKENLKKWLEWDDESLISLNQENLNKIFLWIENSVIVKGSEIRNLSNFIFDDKSIKEMLEKNSVLEGEEHFKNKNVKVDNKIEEKKFTKAAYNSGAKIVLKVQEPYIHDIDQGNQLNILELFECINSEGKRVTDASRFSFFRNEEPIKSHIYSTEKEETIVLKIIFSDDITGVVLKKIMVKSQNRKIVLPAIDNNPKNIWAIPISKINYRLNLSPDANSLYNELIKLDKTFRYTIAASLRVLFEVSYQSIQKTYCPINVNLEDKISKVLAQFDKIIRDKSNNHLIIASTGMSFNQLKGMAGHLEAKKIANMLNLTGHLSKVLISDSELDTLIKHIMFLLVFINEIKKS